MGWFAPSFIAESIAAISPIPSCKVYIASLIIGSRIRFTRNAGESWTLIGVFPKPFARLAMASKVSGVVAIPRINSTSCIAGTGLKKCIPRNFSGRSVDAARRVMEIEEVLLAMMQSL